jgi:DNA-binding NtrC family response regulator
MRALETDREAGNAILSWADVILFHVPGNALEQSTDQQCSLIGRIRSEFAHPMPPIIIVLPREDRSVTLRLIESGAFEVLTSPLDIMELRLTLRRANRFRQLELELAQVRATSLGAGQFDGMVGQSEAMQRVFSLASKIAPSDVSVLITGETGTGKELLARAIHSYSSRVSQPFVAFSCANLPETLVEDELFGHEKGAYTGAVAFRRGRIELADAGTLFLDEVGDLGIAMQPKFLRVLQERTFERLGSSTPIKVNLRVICATNRNLQTMMQEGKFREDLYYRLNVVEIHLPPLRERREDISVLAYSFLERFAKQYDKRIDGFSRLCLQALEEYSWPGNVRELENVIHRLVVLAEYHTIDVWDLPQAIRGTCDIPPMSLSYDEEVKRFKRRLILRTLEECGWRKAKSARSLGVARGYLHRLIHQLEIDEPALTNRSVAVGDEA